jgi:hypothetical protein
VRPTVTPMAVTFCALVRLRRNKQVQVSNFCDEKARANLADYRFAAAMSHCLPLTRKISDGANSHCEAS